MSHTSHRTFNEKRITLYGFYIVSKTDKSFVIKYVLVHHLPPFKMLWKCNFSNQKNKHIFQCVQIASKETNKISLFNFGSLLYSTQKSLTFAILTIFVEGVIYLAVLTIEWYLWSVSAGVGCAIYLLSQPNHNLNLTQLQLELGVTR